MPVQTRRRRGRPSGGLRVADRDKVLDAAERVIARDGNGASIEAIAAEAGVTKPIVYARVGSRADLSNALASRLADRLAEASSAEMVGAEFDRDGLAALFRGALATIRSHRELFLFVTRGSADDTSERALFLAQKSATPLAALLRFHRSRAGLDVSVATPWAFAIVGMLNLVSVWWIEQTEPSVEVLANQLAELVWKGIHVDR